MRAVTFRARQRVELEAWDDPRPGAGEALLRIRAYAYGRDVSISEVARRIVGREMVLGHEPDDP